MALCFGIKDHNLTYRWYGHLTGANCDQLIVSDIYRLYPLHLLAGGGNKVILRCNQLDTRLLQCLASVISYTKIKIIQSRAVHHMRGPALYNMEDVGYNPIPHSFTLYIILCLKM